MRCHPGRPDFCAGCDLHRESVYVVIKRRDGETVFSQNLRLDRTVLLKALAPFRQSLVVTCEACHLWPVLADLFEDTGIPFVLADPRLTAMTRRFLPKNDREDAEHLATLLARGELPTVYAMPRHLRGLRGLNRERIALVRARVRLISRLRAVAQAHGFAGRTPELRGLDPVKIVTDFPDPFTRSVFLWGRTRLAFLDRQIRDTGSEVNVGVTNFFPTERTDTESH